MISRRHFLHLGFGAAWSPVAAAAQSAKKIPRVGYLIPAARPAPPNMGAFGDAALRQGMRELGYIDGETVVFESRYAEGKYDRLPALAADLVRLSVDVIVAVSPNAIQAAKEATKTIPIVMAFSGIDPVKAGFVARLNRPGGNVTGLTMLGSELSVKRLEILKQALPAIVRVGLFINRSNIGNVDQLNALDRAASALGTRLVVAEAPEAGEYEKPIAALKREGAEAVFVLTDTVFARDRDHIIRVAAKHRLPAVFDFKESAEAGGLLSYGINRMDLYRRAAIFVDKILKGARPGELPVEEPSKFDLVINLKTARTLGFTVPHPLLFRADHVIQ